MADLNREQIAAMMVARKIGKVIAREYPGIAGGYRRKDPAYHHISKHPGQPNYKRISRALEKKFGRRRTVGALKQAHFRFTHTIKGPR